MRRLRPIFPILLTLALAGSSALADTGPVVRTTSGPVEGFTQKDAVEFLGIPFAAPPVGQLRWHPPVAPKPWQAVRPAKAFGPSCAQINELGPFAGPPNNNEDCLYLNVFAPKDASGGKAKLPVFVWIYGGGMVDGEANDYDGYKLATMGRIVVVTINYRLNLLGNLAHPALDKEGHPFGGYALLDQQFALKWVKANIARFGGDPGNVTLGGQSAGGSSTGAQLTSPAAKGLFHRAILESAGAYLTLTTLADAEAKGVAFAKAAGCGAGADAATAACLRALPAATIEKLAGSAAGNSAFVVSGMIRDSQILPNGGASAFAAGKFTPMPVMNGTVQDEGGFFTGITMYNAGGKVKTITEADVAQYLKDNYPTAIDAVLKHYPAGRYPSPQLQSRAIQSDAFSCKSHHATQLLSGKVPLYVYEFRDHTAPSYFPDMPGFQPGAYHTADIQFLFPGYHGAGVPHPLNAQQQKLSDRLVTLWANFARTGNPNGKGDAPWPAFGPKAQSYLAEDIAGPPTISESQFAAAHQCAFWESVLAFN